MCFPDDSRNEFESLHEFVSAGVTGRAGKMCAGVTERAGRTGMVDRISLTVPNERPGARKASN